MQTSLVITLLTCAILLKVCKGTATLSIFLSTYNNSEGIESDGNRCDTTNSKCDHIFEVCVGQFECYTTTSVSQNTIDFFRTPITPNPKVFTLNKWRGGILLKVKVWDGDTFSNELVDEFHTTIRMNASRSRSPAKSFTLKRCTELTVQVGVFCDDNWYGPRCHCHPMNNDTGYYHCAANGSKICSYSYYYGPDCNILCLAHDNNDHYNCSSSGTKICHQNWYGSQCTRYCKPSNNWDGHYNCTTDGTKTCHPGWTGDNCTVNIDDCQSYPCINQGECKDQLNGYICKCKERYTGLHCETLLKKEHSTASTTASNNEAGQRTTSTTTSTSASTSASNTPKSQKDDGGGFTPIIIGIVFGVGLLVVIALVAGVVVWKMRRKSERNDDKPQIDSQTENDMALYDVATSVNPQFVDDQVYYNVNGNGTQLGAEGAHDDDAIYENSADRNGTSSEEVYAEPNKPKKKATSRRNSLESVTSELVLQDNEIYS